MAQIKGDLPPDISELLQQVIGEVSTAPRSLAQAQRRAIQAAQKSEDVMRSQGYYGAEVRADVLERQIADEADAKIDYSAIVEITPNAQFKFGTVTLILEPSNDELRQELLEQSRLNRADPAIAARVVSDEIQLLNALTSRGYPDAKLRPRHVIVDHEKQIMDITYNIETGRKTNFGQIRKTGTAQLSKDWPDMISPFRTGDVFDNRQLNKLSTRALATGAFKSATATLSKDWTENGDGTVTRDVMFNIDQGAKNTISGEIGYSTTDGSGLKATYERRNFIGYAQKLTVTATLKTNQIGLAADYNIPYALRTDRELDMGASITRENTDAFKGEKISGKTVLTRQFSDHLKLGAGIGVEASRFEEGNQDVRAYVVELVGRGTFDNRDDILNPETGIFIEGSAVPSYNFGASNGVFTTVVAGASTYKRLSDTLILASRAKGGTIISDGFETIPLNRRFYGGGGGSVRGLAYQSISPVNATGELIGGRSIFEGSAELRYKGESAFGFAAFVDGASVSRESTPDFDNIRLGAGIGVRYYTSFAPLRLDVAIPIDKRPEDADFQVYVSIGQAF